MSYRIEFSPKAARQFKSLSHQVRAFLQPRLEALALNPHSPAVTKLSEAEYESLYRLRAGEYRAFFEIQEENLVVLIVKVGHRRDIYRK